eukprot:scaffold137_cov398-Prasinococcus_capsulatus_cf.AAC.54
MPPSRAAISSRATYRRQGGDIPESFLSGARGPLWTAQPAPGPFSAGGLGGWVGADTGTGTGAPVGASAVQRGARRWPAPPLRIGARVIASELRSRAPLTLSARAPLLRRGLRCSGPGVTGIDTRRFTRRPVTGNSRRTGAARANERGRRAWPPSAAVGARSSLQCDRGPGRNGLMWFTLRTVGLSSRRQTRMVALIILLQWALVWRVFRVDAAAFMKLGDKQREILRGNGEGLLVWANGRTSTGSPTIPIRDQAFVLQQRCTVMSKVGAHGAHSSVPHEHNAFRVNGVASVCNGEKEAFHGVHKKSFFPTPTALSFCQDFATYYGGIRLATHVMPNQVQAPDPESDQFTLKAIPYEDFFGLVRGKTKIRMNWLACSVNTNYIRGLKEMAMS